MTPIQRILIPLDLDESTQPALTLVRKTAERSPTELHLLHVLPAHRLPHPLEASEETRIQAARAALQELARRLEVDAFTVVMEVRSGRPAREIVAYARTQAVDLICMATQGRAGLMRTVLGSVAQLVIREAPCPVLILGPAHAWPTAAATRQVEAAQALVASFGARLNGSYDETRKRMEAVLSRELALAATDASAVLSALESARALDWHGPHETGPGMLESYWSIEVAAALHPAPAEPAGETALPAAEEEQPIPIDLLRRALEARASDVHLDPKGNDHYEVGFRIDGRVEHYCNLDRGIALPLIQQVKVLANLDIAEPFIPQEGRLHHLEALPGVEVRITSAPVEGGPSMALRLHREDQALMPLDVLGFSAAELQAVEQILHAGAGLVLVTGPTGSGKTTTIYSQLKLLAGKGRKIVSIEDPVEYPLPFVRQLNVDTKHDLTMTEGLRTVLRMDPDIVFVSEIRDVESAEIGMRAASSGRFVFSTLHTRDAASSITAVRDLHIDNRSLAANLTGIIAQRLVRRLCPDCARKQPITDSEKALFASEGLDLPTELPQPVGCSRCRETGYRGRIGIFEVVLARGAIEIAIQSGTPEDELRKLLRTTGTASLLADALAKVQSGLTSITETQAMKWV
jgi:type II secretory ATPase GspE/PulE/Tfp pilus assembly ATPase PilB-like protein/nucleotide-binding universal stress UspA family protein